MKVALILSVVALVAVSQPTFFFPSHPFQPCNLIRRTPDDDMQCCIPPQFGGCQAPPGFRRPLPPNYLPPPDFLNNVCCQEGRECCVVDSTDFNVRFTCCDQDQECVETNNKGSCEDKNESGTTPEVDHLESGGQCPKDGSLAIEVRPGEPWRCTLNSNVVQGYTCPTNTHCVRDNTGNVNSGVCCRDTTRTDSDGNVTHIGCNKYSDCHSCVRNEDNDVRAACGWLTQGSLDNSHPRCVVSCDNFPQKSCILPSDGRLCPAKANDTDGFNATIVNTGTCARRCGYIGTGRAAGINNNGNHPTTPVNASEVATTTCCKKFPGDYCCDHWMQLASHCTVGRAFEGPLCGVPIRGTPNALYVPEYEPLGPYVPAPYGSGPSPYGMFPAYGQAYGYGPIAPGIPYGPYGPQFAYIGGPGPRPFGPVPYGPYGPYRSAGDVEGKSADDLVKQLMFVPPPMYYPQPPPPVPVRIPTVVDINPSPFVCSCDSDCHDYADCCSDLEDHCEWSA